MGSPQPTQHQIRESGMPRVPHVDRRLDDQIFRALNRIKKASTAEEITELLNRDLGPGDRPFHAREIEAWLRNAGDKVLTLYWLEARPRR
jgi:hypothetical protein